MMPAMNHMEATPLIDPQRPKPGVNGHSLYAKLQPASLESPIHGAELIMQQFAQLPAIHPAKISHG